MSRKKGALMAYVVLVFQMASSILFTPFLIRTLGQSEYAVYSLVATVTAYLLLFDLGVGNALVRYISKFRVTNDHNNQNKFFGLSIVFYSFIALAVVLVGIIMKTLIPTVFANGLTEAEILLAQKMFGITMINAAVTLFFATFNKAIIAYEKYVLSKVIDVVKITINITLSVALLLMGVGGIGLAVAQLFVTCIGGLFSGYYVFTFFKIRPKFRHIEFGFIKEIFGYCFFVFLQMLATQINSMINQVLIGAFVAFSSGFLAVYAVGTTINNYFHTVAGTINGLLMPGVVKMVEKRASPMELCNEMIRIGRILFIILGLIWTVFVVQGEYFVIVWAGNANAEAYYVSLIIMLPNMVCLIEAIGSQILWAKNCHKIQAVLKCTVAMLNAVLTTFLIKLNPLFGATIGYSLAILVGDVIVMNVIFKKNIGISLKTYYKGLCTGILPSLTATGIVGYLVSLIPFTAPAAFAVCCVTMCIFFFLVMWKFGFTEYEKGIYIATLQKLRRKDLKV